MDDLFERFRVLDRAYGRVENFLVVAFLLLMSAVVFLDVVHRTAGAPAGLSERLVGAGWPARILLGAIYFGLFYAAGRTARLATPLSRRAAALVAGGTVVGLYVLVRLFLWLVPNGLVWAQTLGLVLTLWVGFLGASIATRQGKHLKIDATEKILPERVKPYVETAGNLLTSAACFALCALGALFCADWYTQWQSGGGAFEGFPLPKWIAFSCLPLAFGTMGVRFLVHGVARALGLAAHEVSDPRIQR